MQVTEPVLAQNMHRKDLSAGASIGIVSPDMSYLALSEKSRGTKSWLADEREEERLTEDLLDPGLRLLARLSLAHLVLVLVS